MSHVFFRQQILLFYANKNTLDRLYLSGAQYTVDAKLFESFALTI